MSGYAAVAVYSLKVPSGDEPTPALGLEEYPATFRITMAAIDPTEKPEADADGKVEALPRATLKMIRLPSLPEDSDDEDDEDDEDYDMAHLLDDIASEDDEDEDEEEGAESRKATAEKLKKALAAGGDDMDVDAAADEDDEEEDDEAEDDEDEDDLDDEDLLEGAQEVVLCTLDPTKTYQQTLDITINENEQVFFQVSGSHSVHLSGNILVPLDEDEDSEDEYDSDDEYDLEPGEDELGLLDDDDEEDELDELDDPRVVDVSDDVPAPALVPADAVAQKGKNKRAAEDSPVADKTTNGDAKLTKAQKKAQKKLKNNAGAAVDAEAEETATPAEAAKASPAAKADKKVQFAKTLVQGPTSSTSPKVTAEAPKADAGKPKASLGVKVVQGVTVDDKKLGTGPAAKKGDKVSMRYIGKLDKDKRVFDSNKKGAPFTFKLGAGQVIKGWDIGVAGMSVGGERRITIPANLAYGSKSQKDIPAYSTLVFDLKLLEIK